MHPPQIDTPPPKCLDHVPEDSSPKTYMTTLFNDRFNAVLTVCCISGNNPNVYEKQLSFTAATASSEIHEAARHHLILI